MDVRCQDGGIAITAVTEVSSVIIAAAALFVAVFEARATRRHNRLSVTPKLFIVRRALNSPKRIELFLENRGIGPGFVRSFRVTIDGVTVPASSVDDWPKLVQQLGFHQGTVRASPIGSGAVIPAGSQHELLSVDSLDPFYDTDIAARALMRLGFILDYDSIYGDHFSETSEGPM